MQPLKKRGFAGFLIVDETVGAGKFITFLSPILQKKNEITAYIYQAYNLASYFDSLDRHHQTLFGVMASFKKLQ
jgi:hypothetical protein